MDTEADSGGSLIELGLQGSRGAGALKLQGVVGGAISQGRRSDGMGFLQAICNGVEFGGAIPVRCGSHDGQPSKSNPRESPNAQIQNTQYIKL